MSAPPASHWDSGHSGVGERKENGRLCCFTWYYPLNIDHYTDISHSAQRPFCSHVPCICLEFRPGPSDMLIYYSCGPLYMSLLTDKLINYQGSAGVRCWQVLTNINACLFLFIRGTRFFFVYALTDLQTPKYLDVNYYSSIFFNGITNKRSSLATPRVESIKRPL